MPRQRINRLRIRLEVALVSGILVAVGFALLLAAAVVWLRTITTLEIALAIVGGCLLAIAIVAALIERLWEQSTPPPPPHAEEPDALFGDAMKLMSDTPVAAISQALLSKQMTKSPLVTSVGLAALGLLVMTYERRKEMRRKR